MVLVGDYILLLVQLFDGRTDLEISAKVLTPDLKVLTEVKLDHQWDGLYTNEIVRMPDVKYVIAAYTVKDNGKESEDYEKTTEVIYSKSEPESIEPKIQAMFNDHVPLKGDFYSGQVTHIYDKSEYIEGKISG